MNECLSRTRLNFIHGHTWAGSLYELAASRCQARLIYEVKVRNIIKPDLLSPSFSMA